MSIAKQLQFRNQNQAVPDVPAVSGICAIAHLPAVAGAPAVVRVFAVVGIECSSWCSPV